MLHLQRSFDPTPRSVAQARGFVGSAVACHLDPSRSDDLRICVSELASNALIHAETSFTVRICIDRHGCVRLEVHDQDRNQPQATAALPRDRRATTGRGMFIVERLADEWGVELSATGGKCVWSQFAGRQATGAHNACGTPSPARPAPLPAGAGAPLLPHPVRAAVSSAALRASRAEPGR